MAPLSRKKKTKTISWRKKHNGLPFRTPVCTGWVLLLQRFEPKERLFTAICPFPRKGYGPPGNMFSPHWIPVPDVICLINLFPARMLYSWRCGLDPSGGRREGVGRQQGGTDERKERRMRAQRREMLQHSRGTDRQRRGAGAAIRSDLSADWKKFSTGQRGEGTVAAVQESSELS